MKAVIVKTTGEKSVVEFDNSTAYKTLSGAVGGYIECVHLPETLDLDLWVNEEGKLDGLDFNLFGTYLWVENYGKTDVIVGDIILTSGTDDEGHTLGLSDEQVDYLLGL